MDAIIDFIISKYKAVLTILLISTIPFCYFYAKQSYFNNIKIFFSEDDPDISFYKNFQQTFGNEEVIAIVIKDKEIFTPDNIILIYKITKAVQAVDGVQKVISLTEAEVPVGHNDNVDFEKIIPDKMDRLTQKSLYESKKKVFDHKIFVGNLISKNSTTTAIMIELEALSSNEKKKIVLNKIREKAEKIAADKTTLYYSGGPYLEVEINNLTRSDNSKFIPITFFVVLFVIFLMLRNITLTLLGQLNITVILMWGIGLLIMCGETINIVTVIIAPILLAISIADSVHILSHYKKLYLENEQNHVKAVANSIKLLWRPCMFTSLTTGIGYISFATTNVRAVQIVGIFTSIGVMLAFLMTVTFLPNIMLLSRKFITMNMASKPLSNKKKSITTAENKKKEIISLFLDKTGNLVTKYYKIIGILFLAIFLVTFLGITKLKFETDFINYLKDNNKIKQDIIFVEQNIRGTVPVELVITAKSPESDFTHPESLRLIAKIQHDTISFMKGRYATSISVADYIKQMHMAFNNDNHRFYKIPENRIDIIDYYELGDDKFLKSILSFDKKNARISFTACFGTTENSKKFKNFLNTHVKKILGEKYICTFTGISALYVTMDKNLRTSQIRSFGTAIILIFFIMFFVCKNTKLAIISMIPNLFPVCLTLGIMGWVGIPLDSSTIMIASITIGIAVDDTIHFITWFRRNQIAGLNIKQSILKTYQDTGKPIVITSIVLCIAYFVLLTGSIKPIIAFGALTGLAMFFALIGDLCILPAAICIIKPKINTSSKL